MMIGKYKVNPLFDLLIDYNVHKSVNKLIENWAFGGCDALVACVIAVRHACTCAHLAVCSNLWCEPENYSVVSDYHFPAQQPHFSGALKVTRVEQMAQFPQSF